jgi:hypothetical protein
MGIACMKTIFSMYINSDYIVLVQQGFMKPERQLRKRSMQCSGARVKAKTRKVPGKTSLVQEISAEIGGLEGLNAPETPAIAPSVLVTMSDSSRILSTSPARCANSHISCQGTHTE